MNKNVRRLLTYGITTLVGLLMLFLTLELQGFAEQTAAQERLRILADAFTIPGVTITLFGVLVIIANDGMFYGLSYVFSYAFRMLIPGADKTHERYGDYVARKSETGQVRGFGFLFVVGGSFLLVAVVLTVLYFTV